MNNFLSNHTHRRRAFHVLYVLCSLAVLLIFLRCSNHGGPEPGINHFPPSNFGDMVYGHAHRPYVNRTLVPTTVRLLTAIIPYSLRQSWTAGARMPPISDVLWELDRIPPDYFPEFVIAILLMLAALVGFIYSLRYLVDAVLDAPACFRDWLPLAALSFLPPFFVYTSFLYDMPSLCLSTLCLALMARRRFWAYVAIFAISCVNKETTVLLTVAFVAHFARDAHLGRRRFLGLLSIQIILFVMIKAAIHQRFRHNPGTEMEFHLLDHNLALLRPYDLSTIMAWLGVLVLACARWTEKPRFIRDATWLLVPLLGLGILYGYFDELRIFYEAFAIVLLLIAQPVAGWMRVPLHLRAEESLPT